MGDIAMAVRTGHPVWLRVANFFDRTLELLRELEPPQLVLWKLEFWGTDTPFDKVPASAGVDPAAHAEELRSLGHHVVPYTFSDWSRDRLSAFVPPLKGWPVAVLPIANKRPVAGQSREIVRARFGVGHDDVLVGAGGLLHPAKGVEEVVEGFLRTWPDPGAHMLCSLVPDGKEDTEDAVRDRWWASFGDGCERVHLRVSRYGDWTWMSAFYRAIDLMLVNSVSDSWGRMASEPLALGVPTLVRRSDCGTNHIAPDVLLVDGFTDMSTPVFHAAVRKAQVCAGGLARYLEEKYAPAVVAERLLGLLRSRTPDAVRAAFEEAAARAESRAALEDLAAF
ncbi:MAG: hypothetical protein HYR62_08715 [Actinobacteria bacterium]|nr:hypothetical protein [Actinomycetota bacterium]MBI3687495.1 hypothetical protein [Actinomycetota bacterium]